ncbi:MAG TPA: hypothetical protein VFM29_10170, partial [Vicinamibacteria bacterium]|nr:hypothetical protein [Vicinamibacteria bacterium]
MVPGYKVRLGDGTAFAVDENGLLTWLAGGLVDRAARIQPQGCDEWLTVRQLLRWEPAALAPAAEASAPRAAATPETGEAREEREAGR